MQMQKSTNAATLSAHYLCCHHIFTVKIFIRKSVYNAAQGKLSPDFSLIFAGNDKCANGREKERERQRKANESSVLYWRYCAVHLAEYSPPYKCDCNRFSEISKTYFHFDTTMKVFIVTYTYP